MPDMPQPAGPGSAPPSGSPSQDGSQPPAQGGGGFGDAVVQVDQTLNKIAQAVAQNPQVSDDVKKKFADALAAFRDASQALVKAVGGEGGEPDGDEAGGTVTPEQGASGAQPMTHANMRGG